ncbi:hypothetical protein Tsubulata_030448 [Turnera subulata]|uniref:CCHC-type domain-containing protein n=1 Tax=Turnera subulata TaxID=218843 RepID=A0A9Q0JJS0_9ROSI|nr:hypothetical protein Tsubulata_030448 [Turnera subulata]
MRTIRQVWKASHDVHISQLDKNLFVFQFHHWRDKERVLEQEPWNFHNQIVLLREVKGFEQPSELSVFHVPIWARTYDVPLNYIREHFIEQLGNKMGSFLQLDPDRGLGQGKFIQFRVVKDVRTPILRGSTVTLKDGKEAWIYYKYERLPFFFYHCGRMGHIAKDCSLVDDDDLLNPALYQYGEELRASPLRRPVLFHGERNTDKVRRKLVFKPSRLGGTSSEGVQSRSGSGRRVKEMNCESHNGTANHGVTVENKISSKLTGINGEDVVIISDRPESILKLSLILAGLPNSWNDFELPALLHQNLENTVLKVIALGIQEKEPTPSAKCKRLARRPTTGTGSMSSEGSQVKRKVDNGAVSLDLMEIDLVGKKRRDNTSSVEADGHSLVMEAAEQPR